MEGSQMNQLMKIGLRETTRLRVIDAEEPVAGLAAVWARLRNRLGRITLLLASPVASFRWELARRKAMQGRKHVQMSLRWQGPSGPETGREEKRVCDARQTGVW